jgi:UDPglucose 6-dehydrogenase
MKVAVIGMWHLGSVTAACLARLGHDVAGLDEDAARVAGLAAGRPPVAEPGLAELVAEGLAAGRLRFTTSVDEAVSGADVVWVAIDTPVDEDDRADVPAVEDAVARAFPFLSPDAMVLVSSQLPVGTTRRLQARHDAAYPGRNVTFACSPENLRLGKALEVFLDPDRLVIGARDAAARARLAPLVASITDRVEWMSVESAEMVKHALNAFLATSVAFANEIATVCESVGADAPAVARALKSDARIGPRAYLSPGAAFAGGTLARDVVFLGELGDRHGRALPLLRSVKTSNDAHRGWPARRVVELLGDVRGRRIAIWGLTYKPGTDTLRRSSAIEWCRALGRQGAVIRAYDPAIGAVPWPVEDGDLELARTALGAVAGAEALIVSTEWPEFRDVAGDAVARAAPGLAVVDPSRFLAATLGVQPGLRYVTVGSAS